MNKRVIFSVFLFIFSFSSWGFDGNKLDQLLETLAANDRLMVSVAVTEHGQPIYQKAVGFADIEADKKADIHTRYRIGSITKTFTATLIFQLIEEGKLSLDTPLANFYPQIKNAEDITIAMMLSHRSGIHNYTDLPNFFATAHVPKSKQEMLKLLASLDSDFTPGSKASYSNSAYMLLGFIIEDISGKAYVARLQSHILDRLSLTETTYGDVKNDAHRARSHMFQQSTWQGIPEADHSVVLGAGAIISTPTDVAKFLSGLFAGKLVSSASFSKMKTIKDGYGSGLARYPFNDKTLYGHDGVIDGFISYTAIQEDDDVAVAVFTNGINYPLNDVNIAVFSCYYGNDFDIPDFSQQAITLTTSSLKRFEGVFASDALPLKITFFVKDDQLYAQATGQGPLPLTPFSPYEFRFEPARITIVFDSNGSGIDVDRFTLQQGGGKFPFVRE